MATLRIEAAVRYIQHVHGETIIEIDDDILVSIRINDRLVAGLSVDLDPEVHQEPSIGIGWWPDGENWDRLATIPAAADQDPRREPELADHGLGSCWCGQPATVLIDSDSILFPDGRPVCAEHDTGDRPEERII